MSYYDKYIKYKKKYLALKGGAGGESKSGEGKSGENKSGAEAKSSENFLDRPHLVAIVRYTEYSENVPQNQIKLQKYYFLMVMCIKRKHFYEASFGDIETEGKIILERSIVLHQKESKDLISFLGGIDNDYYYYKTIEILSKHT